jgi:hypothetical protein
VLGVLCAESALSKEEMKMTTSGMYDASVDLDAESDHASRLTGKQRSRRKIAMLSLLSAALLVLFGAMVARTTADTPPVRMGTSR